MEAFPREQIRLVCSEDLIFDDPAAVVERVQVFLGLPLRRPAKLKNYSRAAQTAINEATLSCSKEHFRPQDQRLFEYLGTDFKWRS